MSVRDRLVEFMRWRGWSQQEMGAACEDARQATISKIITGQRTPGLPIALAIERVTGAPKEDGSRWAPGPIAAEEWLAPVVAAGAEDVDSEDLDTAIVPRREAADA